MLLAAKDRQRKHHQSALCLDIAAISPADLGYDRSTLARSLMPSKKQKLTEVFASLFTPKLRFPVCSLVQRHFLVELKEACFSFLAAFAPYIPSVGLLLQRSVRFLWSAALEKKLAAHLFPSVQLSSKDDSLTPPLPRKYLPSLSRPHLRLFPNKVEVCSSQLHSAAFHCSCHLLAHFVGYF